MKLQEAVEQGKYTLTLHRLNRGPEVESLKRLIDFAEQCLRLNDDETLDVIETFDEISLEMSKDDESDD